jgi:hypothetical protein
MTILDRKEMDPKRLVFGPSAYHQPRGRRRGLENRAESHGGGHGGGLLETGSAAKWNLDLCAKLEASRSPHVVFGFLRSHLTSMDEHDNHLSYQREPRRHL